MAVSVKDINVSISPPTETRSKKGQPRQGAKGAETQPSLLISNSATGGPGGDRDPNNHNNGAGGGMGAQGNVSELLARDATDLKNGDEGIHRRES